MLMVTLRGLNPRLLIFTSVFALIGLSWLLLTKADTIPPSVSVQAEDSLISAPATKVDDAPQASGNAYVKFGSPIIPPLVSKICGTWALQQADSYTDFYNRYRFTTANAMSYENIRGFSFRLPWKAATDNNGLVDQFRQADALINQYVPGTPRQSGKDYSIRFMAGRHTPQYVFDNGAYFYTLTDGTKIPKPFSDSGVAGNPAFENAYRATVSSLATWARANGVSLIHLPWYGQDWAELHNALNIRDPNIGYSYQNWLQGHKNLIDIALEFTGPRADGTNLAVEFPMSGSGPLVGNQFPAIHDLSSYIQARAGVNSEKTFIQANGWGPVGWGYGDWGATDAATEAAKDTAAWTKQVLRGEQAIQGESNYNWDTMYDMLRTNDAKYAEVYVASFRTNIDPNSTAKLRSNITSFRTHACQ